MTETERFDAKWVPEPNSGCWLWTANALPSGYGNFWFRGKHGYAHRASYEMFRCEIPEGMQVCHKCDVPSCVNPDHLFLGTPSDNMRDAWNKGRLPLPPKNIRNVKIRKLSPEDRETIRTSRDKGRDLARRFNISPGMVSMIRSGKRKAI